MKRVAGATLLLAILVATSCATRARGACAVGSAAPRGAGSGQNALLTEQTLFKVRAAIDAWRATYESYPPSAMRRIPAVAGVGGPTSGSGTNEGIEALYQALYWPGFEGRPTFADSELCNTDEDRLRRAINTRGVPDLLEIRDAWGNPLIYIESSDYVEVARGGAVTITANGERIEPVPHEDPRGAFVHPTSYQLFSLGPDGKPNTDDDVRGWHID